MIRLTWLQARNETLVAAVCLIALAIALATTGPHLLHVYDATVVSCGRRGDCSSENQAFLQTYRGLQIALDVLVVVVPGLIGLFVGAPLVAHELEAGTFRLMWTQSVTRSRWMAVKLGVGALGSMLVAGLLSLAVTWWSSPVDRVAMNQYVSFEQRDLVPIGYAAFAFVLGATLGLVLRRTVPAMAATLASFVGIRLLVGHYVRAHLLAPAQLSLAMSGKTVNGFETSPSGTDTLSAATPNLPNAWIISERFVGRNGQSLPESVLKKECGRLFVTQSSTGAAHGGLFGTQSTQPANFGSGNPFGACAKRLADRYHLLVSYQPANHYWTLQWLELGLYLVAAGLIAAGCVWLVRRRLT